MLVLIGLTLLGYSLRIAPLGLNSFWMDEITTVWWAKLSLPEIWTVARNTDVYPPGFYILEHYWVYWVGTTEFAVRYISLAAGVMVIPINYALVRRLFGHGEGLIAAVLMPFSPVALNYSQENRSHSTMILLSALLLYLAYRISYRLEVLSWLSSFAEIAFAHAKTC